jgi:hypothetical protein
MPGMSAELRALLDKRAASILQMQQSLMDLQRVDSVLTSVWEDAARAPQAAQPEVLQANLVWDLEIEEFLQKTTEHKFHKKMSLPLAAHKQQVD